MMMMMMMMTRLFTLVPTAPVIVNISSLPQCGNTTAAHAPLLTGPLHTEPSVKTSTVHSLCCSMNSLTVSCCRACPSEDLLYTSLTKMSILAIGKLSTVSNCR